MTHAAPGHAHGARAAVPVGGGDRSAAALTESVAKPKSNEHVITAPMVGTFYACALARAPRPFVEIGDEVKVGQVLCIIEAMKMMNQIESRQGRPRHRRSWRKNGDPVEFGQPLFVIE